MEAKTKMQEREKHFAIANSYNLPISKKDSTQIANFIRGKELSKAKNLLNLVLEKKIAVPYTKHHMDLSHKRGQGVAAGAYPQNATKNFLSVMNTAETNAKDLGLDVSKLIITEVIANEGTHQMRPGRHSRRRMKRCHLKIKVEEK